MKKKKIKSGVKTPQKMIPIVYPDTNPHRPEHTPEEIAVMKDHIDNWNPYGHILDYIKNKQYSKVCKLLKRDLFHKY